MNKLYDELWNGEPSAELYKNIGHCNKYLKNDENAIEYYKKSLEIAPDNLEVIFNLAETLKDLTQLQEALEYYKKISENPKFKKTYIGKISKQKQNEIQSTLISRNAAQLLKEEKFEEALQAFSQALKLNPKDRRNYLNISVVYLKQGNIVDAILWMQKTIETDPYYIRAYFNLGTIYFQMKRFKKAINIYEKAINIAPNDPECNDIKQNLELALENYHETLNEILQFANAEKNINLFRNHNRISKLYH